MNCEIAVKRYPFKCLPKAASRYFSVCDLKMHQKLKFEQATMPTSEWVSEFNLGLGLLNYD